MTSYPETWAKRHAPVLDTYEKLILIELASNADPDGCDAFTSKDTLAHEALCSETKVKEALKGLKQRGLIRRQRDNPNKAAWLSRQPRYRTVPYELMIPYSWWSDDMRAEVNRVRADRGTNAEPLTPEARPDLPSRARQGVATRPLNEKPQVTQGVATRPPEGDTDTNSQVTDFRGASHAPKPSSSSSEEEYYSSSEESSGEEETARERHSGRSAPFTKKQRQGQQAKAVALITEATDATKEEAQRLIAGVTYDYSLKGYIQTMVENGTVWGQLQKLREPVSDSAADSSGSEQQPADPVSGGGSSLPAWCGECDASGAHNPRLRLVQRPPWETGPDDRCAACHPARVAALEGTDAA